MAITKRVIESYVGDTIQHTLNVTLNGTASTDMSAWAFRVEMRRESTNEIVIANGDVSYDVTASNTAAFGFAITDEQTGTLTADTYKIYAKLQAPTTGDEYTVLDATVPLATIGVD